MLNMNLRGPKFQVSSYVSGNLSVPTIYCAPKSQPNILATIIFP